MTEKDSLIIFLKENVKKEIPELVDFGIKIYLFGSALYTRHYEDIDLLIVYDQKISIKNMLKLRKQLKNDGLKFFKKKFDICLLSKKEDKNNPFRKEENAKLLIG